MLIELRKGMTLHPGTFNAVIAPVKVMVSALNSTTDLQRFLFLYMSGSSSRLLFSISRSFKNFMVRRAFTALQIFTILKEAGNTVVLVEHDPALFDGAETMIPQIAGMLREAGRESLVILYAPSIDRSFSLLMRQADRIMGFLRLMTEPGFHCIADPAHLIMTVPFPVRSGPWRCHDGKKF